MTTWSNSAPLSVFLHARRNACISRRRYLNAHDRHSLRRSGSSETMRGVRRCAQFVVCLLDHRPTARRGRRARIEDAVEHGPKGDGQERVVLFDRRIFCPPRALTRHVYCARMPFPAGLQRHASRGPLSSLVDARLTKFERIAALESKFIYADAMFFREPLLEAIRISRCAIRTPRPVRMARGDATARG